MIEKFHDTLRDNGRSITKARTLLFGYLQEHGPVSPQQFGADNASVADRASLYRTLALFRQIGVVEDRLVNGRRLLELTDSYDAHHHHFTCTRCGRTIALEMPRLEEALNALCAANGLRSESHSIEVSGTCRNCLNERPAERPAGTPAGMQGR